MAEKRNSRVIRVSNDTLGRLEGFKTNGSWESALKSVLGEGSEVWGINEDLYHTKAQARGAAMKQAVKEGLKQAQIGTPVKLLKVGT